MYYNFKALYNKQIPSALEKLCELIDDTYEQCEEKGITPRWHTNKYFTEYGFYIDSGDKKMNLFFGIWVDHWSLAGNPLFVCLDWKSHTDPGKTKKFKDFIETENDVFSKYIEYNEVPSGAVSLTFLNSIDGPGSIVETLKRLLDELDFDRYFNKS